MGRPSGAVGKSDIPSLIEKELDKRCLGWKKRALIAKGAVNACLPRDENGVVSPEGRSDIKAVTELANRLYGKPVENRTVQHNILHYYPQLESKVKLEDYDNLTKAIPVEPIEAVTS